MARTPRARHVRHREFDRLRHSQRFLEWLSAQATRLTTTSQAVFTALRSMLPSEIEALANIDIPANTVLPAITGTAQVAQVLTSSTGTWTGVPAPSYTYQWKLAGAAIDGETDNTYTVRAGDVGSTVTVTVTATNAGGSVSATSAATAAVIA